MDKLKVSIRIPTRSYAYYEIEAEVETTQEATELYFEAEKYYKELEIKQEKKLCCSKYPRCHCKIPIKK